MDKSVLVARPINQIYAYVLDCRNSKNYLGKSFNFEPLTPPPYEVGAQAMAVGHFAGFSLKLLYEVVELQPDRLIRLYARNQSVSGVKVDSEVRWSFAERESGQILVGYHLSINPHSDSMAGIGVLVARTVLHAIESGISHMLDDAMLRLKHILESQSVEAGKPA
jgi:hypothetical protein